jgi:SAM-dependent methyltransferase
VADPKVDPASLESQTAAFNRAFAMSVSPETAAGIRFFRDTREVPPAYDGRIDLICSHNVLEHVSDLESFYADNARLLSPTGESCHRVDLSDHTYHLFSKFPRLAALGGRRSLYHLRYSKAAFRILGDSKTYMNRTLLPAHLALIRQAGLRVTELQRTPFPKIPIHPDLLRGLPPAPPENLYLTDFFLKLSK